MMVTAKFDKIHRCINDMKDAAKKVAIMVKTKLWSSYLLSLNKRPFNSGAFGTAKTRMLESFKEQVDIYHPVFLKFLPRLSKLCLGLPNPIRQVQSNGVQCIFHCTALVHSENSGCVDWLLISN